VAEVNIRVFAFTIFYLCTSRSKIASNKIWFANCDLSGAKAHEICMPKVNPLTELRGHFCYLHLNCKHRRDPLVEPSANHVASQKIDHS
jgi:hypothetical protein